VAVDVRCNRHRIGGPALIGGIARIVRYRMVGAAACETFAVSARSAHEAGVEES
jgi:hypothetical protein